MKKIYVIMVLAILLISPVVLAVGSTRDSNRVNTRGYQEEVVSIDGTRATVTKKNFYINDRQSPLVPGKDAHIGIYSVTHDVISGIIEHGSRFPCIFLIACLPLDLFLDWLFFPRSE